VTLPIPTPAALAQRFAAGLSQQTFVASDGSSVTLDATAPQTLEQALSVLYALGDYEAYLYMRDIARELMPTTATDVGLLPDHARVWGKPRLSATSAIGYVVIAASSSLTIPQGALITVDGSAQWSVDAAISISAGSAASVSVTATAAGISGNLAANSAAQMVSPIAGVTSITTDQDGLTGGGPIEPVESWRSRILSAIRSPVGGGTIADYRSWAINAGAAYVNVVRAYGGAGTAGVIVAMSGPTAPSAAQVAAVQLAIDGQRPVRGNVTVYAASIVPQALTIALSPDTVSAQTAVTAALGPVFVAAGIGGSASGGKVTIAAIEAAIAAVAGTDNDLVSPTSDIVLAADQMATLGTITWQARG